MLGSYDFCAHYEWTFAWLERQQGPEMVRKYWEQAISQYAQMHARKLIVEKGIDGMREYWAHTLEEEAAGYTITEKPGLYRIDMQDCPSKGFLIRNKLENYSDYCDHCIGWMDSIMDEAGFKIDHEHNHRGQCWWEIRKKEDASPASPLGQVAEQKDVRLREGWRDNVHHRFGSTLDTRKTFLKPNGRVVLYADEHFNSGGRKGLAAALHDLTGQPPFVINAASKSLTEADLSDAGLLVLYHTQEEPDSATKAALQSWVKANKPLLLVHAALGAYPNWEEYKSWAGRVWIWQKSEHPQEEAYLSGVSTGWSEAIHHLPKDEVFIKLGDVSECRDLLHVEIFSGKFPAAWISKKFPHIGVWTPGHSENSWQVPAMREGIAMLIGDLLRK